YKKSQQEGNRLMKSPDGFDHQSELLQTSIARLSSEINQKQTSTAAEVEQNIHFSQSISLLLSALMIAVILTAGRILYVRVFTQLGGEPASGVKMAQAIAMGDLTQKICVEGNNRDSLLGHLDAMRARWTDVVSSLNGQVWLMLKEFGDLKQQSEAMAEHCGKQNEATMSISANVEELSVTAEQIADRSCAAAKQALRSGKSSEQAMKIIADMVSEIENAFGHVKHSVQLSSTLDQCTNEIESVTTTIRAIAEQTNLLALNAAIEAARAGESGRGFAVVADEVRQLATRAAEATSFIEKLISEVRKNTGEIVQVIGHGTDKVRSSLQCSEKAIHAINEVLSDSALTRSEVDFINNALTEQKAAMQDIVEKIVHIATMSDKNAHAADAISHTAQNLDAVAQAVQKEISYFKFADEETGKPRGDVLF
ncbi:MAG TPA: methyl-accepting chemotaxis protein, partial [Pseudomonadales bacterium]|nr:methyl-accepting chemotaxis protein [Pseudomonadales bacterium]